ncbi:phenylalanine--tRNA ligase beta subunit-related protein [Nocardioides sp.]|uniref:B3/B4 domain-containing protein n=1 Tax=Nocardioides sp. TaxID=35761 RepID=UPI00286E43AE|nr:phenylalanine--tRNA ligase beta subunit-related protein [Nocardioides sp.]
MPDVRSLEDFLARARVDPAVFDLRPDYRALLVAVDDITPAALDARSEALVRRAGDVARELLDSRPVEQLPHVAAWREAYRAFGAKPQRTRNSLEALMSRAAGGLPRVNAITDIYNAISVIHQVPLGGEDRDRYTGAPRLVRSHADEPFDTVAEGRDVTEHPAAGEVVWCDDAGVTCRRWNWRQARRTLLHEDTSKALFILDALDPMTTLALEAAAEDLLHHLGPGVVASQRLLAAP